MRRQNKPSSVAPAKFEQGARAVMTFKNMIPGFTSYARAITENKRTSVKIVSSGASASYTDGKSIFIRPPLELGDNTRHERHKCDKRDAIGTPLCDACRIRERVLVMLYHEISHIAFKSFDNPNPYKIAAKLEAELYASENEFAIGLARKIPTHPDHSLQKFAASVNEFLPTILNSLEDVRVNGAMFASRPGTLKMFESHDRKIFTTGVEQPDGSIMKWSEYPLNMQAIIGLYCLGSGYEYDGFFAEQVVNDLADYDLGKICFAASDAKTADEVFLLAARALIRLHDLGYCKSDNDPKEENQEEGEDGSETGDGGEADSDEQQDSGSDESGSSSDDVGGDSDSEPTDSPESGESGDQDSSANSDSESDELTDGRREDESGSSDSGADDSEAESGDDADGRDDGGSESLGDSSPEETSESETSDGDAGDGESDDGGAEPDDGDGSQGAGSEPEPKAADYGTAEATEEAIKNFFGHDADCTVASETPASDLQAIEVGIIQGEYFDAPSGNVVGVREYKGAKVDSAWPLDYKVPDEILIPALLRMRVAFADNKRSKDVVHLKSGKVNARVLGKRAWGDDERLFKKKITPNKRSYFVVIGIDISGSTIGNKLVREKKAVLAQCELLARMGIEFAVIAHTGNGDYNAYQLGIYWIKESHENWTDVQRKRLLGLQSKEANIDGHTLEFYRKLCDRSQATDKIIMYYTDGAMPLENYDEELEILQREIKICQRKRYTLMGVGVNTDSPKQHGLDTVSLDVEEDVIKVVRHLEKRLER